MLASAPAASLAVFPALTPGEGHAAASTPSIDELLRDAEVQDTALSPDGTRAAILTRRKTASGAYEAIVEFYEIVDADGPTRPVSLGDVKVERIEWANEERLLVWVKYEKDPNGKPSGYWSLNNIFVPRAVHRLLAIGVDGKNGVLLFNNMPDVLRRIYNLSSVADMLADDRRAILMRVEGPAYLSLYKVDVYTGEAVLVENGSRMTYDWFIQNGEPLIRYDFYGGGMVGILVRAPGEKDWKRFRKVRRNELEQLSDFDIVAATPEAGVLLALTLEEGDEMPVVRKFDTRTLKLGEVFLSDATRPIEGVFVDEGLNTIAFSISDDRLEHSFLDPRLNAHYRALTGFFGPTVSVRPFDISRDHKRLIFHVSGPRQPGAYWLYDVEKKDVKLLGESRPWLTEARLAPMKALRAPTRDGQTITAYLSTPAGAPRKPMPLVVLPHGGPETRDSFAFDLFAQAFAARGWLVLQPNFRGSGGYGRSFADAGRKHWGDLMQADVEDCVAHAMASGIVDTDRVAICGASYGGYAALMGAVRKPDLYKAAVSIAGVSDLVESLARTRNAARWDPDTYAYWRKTIGELGEDKAMLIASSPARRCAEIKAPVLLIHGVDDRIVPVNQSRIMAEALKAAGKPSDLIELPEVGHTKWSEETWKLVLTKSVDHIAKAFA